MLIVEFDKNERIKKMINLFKSANLSNVIFSIVSIAMCVMLFLFLKSNGFVAADILGMQNGEGES